MRTDSVNVMVYEERDDGEWTLEARVNYGYASLGAYYHANPLEVIWTKAIDPEGIEREPEALDWLDDDAELRDAATERAHERLHEMSEMYE